MLELRESPKEVGHALAQTDLADKENLKPVCGRFADAPEAIESHAVGDLVELLRGNAHFDERSPRKFRRHCDGVGLFILILFASDEARIDDDVVFDTPPIELLAKDAVLVADVR